MDRFIKQDSKELKSLNNKLKTEEEIAFLNDRKKIFHLYLTSVDAFKL